jgi:hypothetical protein
MEQRKSKRSVRLALVLGAAVAGTALVGWGGLAAWQAYTQNAGNAFAVGTLSHINTVGSVTCDSTTTQANASQGSGKTPCSIIVSGASLDNWNAPLTGSVIIQSTGLLSSTFQMEMQNAPAPVKSGDGNLCGYLTLTVTDNEQPAATPYGPKSLSDTMTATTLYATNSDGTSTKPWVTGDTGTYTFSVAPGDGSTAAYTAFDSNPLVLGSSCSFDVLFDQASA